MLKVLVVDDQRMVSSGFSLILSVEDDIDVVGTASNGAEAIEAAERLRPDVILMDVQMPVMDGIEATKRLVNKGIGRVVILTTFDRDDYLFSALDAGASGFLLKNADADELADAVRAVGLGHALLAPEVTRRVIESRQQGIAENSVPQEDSERLEVLTRRERDVLELIGRGLSNAEIAAELFVGESTVKTHVSNVLMKLKLRDRVQAAIAAYETGLIRVR